VLANAVICALGLFGLVTASAADPASQVTSIVPIGHRHPARDPTTTPGSQPTATTTPPAGQGVTAIGDSIMVDAAPYLEQSLPGIAIDAQVGLQLSQVQSAVPQLKGEGAIGNRLILELGTNGPYTSAQLVALLDSLGPMRRIVLVNTRVPRSWQQQVNDTIAGVSRTYPNTTVVNWYADSAAYPQYLYPDGVHLNATGAKYYASLLVRALEAPRASSQGPPPKRAGSTSG
jgi:hypothetical protein